MPLIPNQQLFEYQIIRRIGQGAFGTVYLAHDTLLDRPVAIKELTITTQTEEAALNGSFKKREQRAIPPSPLITVHVLKIRSMHILDFYDFSTIEVT